MKISQLLDCDSEIQINGITDDSRLVKNGFLFVATKGYHVDHYDYIEDAIKNGCSFIVCDRELKIIFPHKIVDNIFQVYIDLCKKYYKVFPSEFHFIGITGTDGKTTTSMILKHLMGDASYLGTNGLYVGEDIYDTSNTTPCISEFYKDLSIIKKHHCNTVSMEVSSEAILHNRVEGISFDMIGFTNITGDHIEIHGSFQEYLKCKLKLIDYLNNNGIIVLNGDDTNLKKIKHSQVICFGYNLDNDYVITKTIIKNKKTIIHLKNKDHTTIILSPYFGKYNIYNIVMAYIMALKYGICEKDILKRIKELPCIPGRCEFLDFGQKYDIVLDYAHTINGIQSIIDSFSHYNNIIVVTGCAGGRDHDKRSIIGKYVIEHSDISIFTMDDPRYEDVESIIDDMAGESKDYFRIIDREDAIKYALTVASPGSVILILGKGRDNYMAIKDKKIHYSDYDVVYNYFH